ncbi:MAG: 50S ribosomal protein L9 [Ignavibacteria bacterium GWF2_33_9]|nr:MAG: 50S ribosomal protein L9 [Ignavibacteria bacterium GWF2_33_9]
MKIILRKNVANIGTIGDVVNVKDGYARNYLFPRELAYMATDSSLKRIEIEKRKTLAKMVKEKEMAEKFADELANVQLSISMKVGEEGQLYGSVTSLMISEKLAENNFEIDKRNVLLDDAIKTLGIFDVKVRLHPEVIASVKVWVMEDEA